MTSLGLDLLADVVITGRKHDTLNSMEVNYVSGIGEKDGEAMDFRAGFFQLALLSYDFYWRNIHRPTHSRCCSTQPGTGNSGTGRQIPRGHLAQC